MLFEAHRGCLSGPCSSKGCVFLNPSGHLEWGRVSVTDAHTETYTHTQLRNETSNNTQQSSSLLISKSVPAALVSYNNSAGSPRGFTRHIYNWINGSISTPELDLKYYLCVFQNGCVSVPVCVYLFIFSLLCNLCMHTFACVVPRRPH